jgi:hypothetical protein
MRVLILAIALCARAAVAAESAPPPAEIEQLKHKLFNKAYATFLQRLEKSHPDWKLGNAASDSPPFHFAESRESWPEIFATTAHAQIGVTAPSMKEIVEASQKEFLVHLRGHQVALFTSVESVEFETRPQALAVKSRKRLALPTAWPEDHTLNLQLYLGALFPPALQKFVRDTDARLVLDDSNCRDAYAIQRREGFSRAFAFKGDRGDTVSRTFLVQNTHQPKLFRFVACQIRGQDDAKLYVDGIGVFFHGPATIIHHAYPAPISQLNSGATLRPGERVIIGYQNAVWRTLSNYDRDKNWHRDFLTSDGVEIDRFSNQATGQRLLSVKNVYGDEILAVLRLLWARGARNFLYLGSAGSLDGRIEVGDLVLPSEFLERAGRWTLYRNEASGAGIALPAPFQVHAETRHGFVATLIEETKLRVEEMGKVGIQEIDIEARHFAHFFCERNATSAIVLAITDSPRGKRRLDEGYEVNFLAAKNISLVVPALLKQTQPPPPGS